MTDIKRIDFAQAYGRHRRRDGLPDLKRQPTPEQRAACERRRQIELLAEARRLRELEGDW